MPAVAKKITLSEISELESLFEIWRHQKKNPEGSIACSSVRNVLIWLGQKDLLHVPNCRAHIKEH